MIYMLQPRFDGSCRCQATCISWFSSLSGWELAWYQPCQFTNVGKKIDVNFKNCWNLKLKFVVYIYKNSTHFVLQVECDDYMPFPKKHIYKGVEDYHVLNQNIDCFICNSQKSGLEWTENHMLEHFLEFLSLIQINLQQLLKPCASVFSSQA